MGEPGIGEPSWTLTIHERNYRMGNLDCELSEGELLSFPDKEYCSG